MNVINAYLETMFSAYPQTPRLLEAKTELHGMMEDAYTSLIAAGHSENEAVGQVIRDFGNLQEVAPVLGITSDVTPTPAYGSPPVGTHDEPVPAHSLHPPVTLQDAEGYADARRRIRFRVSTAVLLFVVAPSALIALPVAAHSDVVPFTEEVGTFLGLLVLLVLVAAGVLILVTTSRETAPYKDIAEGRFTADPAVTRWADDLAERHDRGRVRALQVAVALWILAPVPLIAFSLLLDGSPQNDVWTAVGVVLVLAIVATGLGVLLPQTWAHTVAAQLGRAAATSSSADERSIVQVIAAFYWPLLTAIFLAWSFIGDAWGVSWIVWPVGAVLFGAITAGGRAVENYRAAR